MTCTCTPAWPHLVAIVDGQERPAEPAEEHSAAEADTHALCGQCRTPYPGHWTLTKAPAATVDDDSAVGLLRRIVAQRPKGEVRPQQERMVGLVEDAIKKREHLLVQAGTGTGKSLGYLIPAVASGKRVVVSTATKQLSEQIVDVDMPVLADLIPKVGGDEFTYALIKGRQNYACLKEIDSINRLEEEADSAGANSEQIQDALFGDSGQSGTGSNRRPSPDDLAKLNSLLTWATETETGDRSHAPAVPDRVWNQVSTDSAGCVGRQSCPFGEDCFAEFARAEAKVADVVVTNHAQVAQDLISEGEGVLGDFDVLITDEVHELESYLSSAWGVEFVPSSMVYAFAQAGRRLPKDERYDDIHTGMGVTLDQFETISGLLADMPEGLMVEMRQDLGQQLVSLGESMRTVSRALGDAAKAQGVGETQAADRKSAAQKIDEMVKTIIEVCADVTDGTRVRWVEPPRGNRGAGIKVAPLWIGPQLMETLGERTLVATSATITVGGSFDSFVRTLALNEPRVTADGTTKPPRPFQAVDVGTPFDYSKQAMLFIPPTSFPAPVWENRQTHQASVHDLLVDLVAAAGGRTLALFTSRKDSDEAAAYLRLKTNYPILAQGDAPPSQLIEEFKNDESTVLCATMGFWHGVDAPGPTCSLVVLNKAPFAPMNDPLLKARRDAADKAGRSGFDEVFVAGASVMLAQGVGRLIRTSSDKGVIAILDNRLLGKAYGRTMIGSMPPMAIFRDKNVVAGSLKRLADLADGVVGEGAATGAGASAAQVAAARQRGRATAAAAGGVGAVESAPARRAAPSAASTRAMNRRNRPAPAGT